MKVLTDKTAAELVRHLRASALAPTRRARMVHGGGGGGVVGDAIPARLTGGFSQDCLYMAELFNPSTPGNFGGVVGRARLVLTEVSQFARLPVGAVVLAHPVKVPVEASVVEEES